MPCPFLRDSPISKGGLISNSSPPPSLSSHATMRHIFISPCSKRSLLNVVPLLARWLNSPATAIQPPFSSSIQSGNCNISLVISLVLFLFSEEYINPFLHPNIKHLFYIWRVYWDPLYIDLIILKVIWNPLELYLLTPKVCVDPMFKDILTTKVSWDPGGRMQRFNYT